jgi:hypothetical protein
MHKWKKITSTLEKTTPTNDVTIDNKISQSVQSTSENLEGEGCEPVSFVPHKVQIDSSNKSDNINKNNSQLLETTDISDSYNGAIRENYIWSQTFSDLNVLVKIPEHVKKMKNAIRVDISSMEMKIDVKSNSMKDSEWDNIFNGKLSYKIRKDESMWSIIPGKHISVLLLQIKDYRPNFLEDYNIQFVI